MNATSSSKKGHTVAPKKPILEYEETEKGDILVRLSDDDVEFKQVLYRWIAMHGMSVHEAKDEFSLMGRIQIPSWKLSLLSDTFEMVRMEG